jgi:TonB family protein
MRQTPRAILSLLIACAAFAALSVPQRRGGERIGPAITPPRLVHKVEPEYTMEARKARVQATIAVEVVISEQGLPEDITVLSPAGYGLDECAEAAIRKWVFQAGQKNGKPIPVLATVEVNFRFLNVPFDSDAEQRRTEFNVALAHLSRTGDKVAPTAVKTIERLAKKNFVPAIYQMSLLYSSGKLVPLDTKRGAAMLADAAKRKYAPAMYDQGMRLIAGEPASRDIEKGLGLLRGAAERGSIAAQFNLGVRYEKGDGVEADGNKAIRYLRLCAVKGEQVRQSRLGTLPRADSGGDDRRQVEAVAWLDLAADQGYAEATKLLDIERRKLTAEQRAAVAGLKKVLLRK